jgi:hypothetical protein
MKSVEEKISEKQRTLADVNKTLEQSLKLYDITTSHYGNLYTENKAKVESSHIAGIASLLSKINELLRTRNDIENEINGLLELDEQQNIQSEVGTVTGSKETILKLMDGKRK